MFRVARVVGARCRYLHSAGCSGGGGDAADTTVGMHYAYAVVDFHTDEYADSYTDGGNGDSDGDGPADSDPDSYGYADADAHPGGDENRLAADSHERMSDVDADSHADID